MNIVRSGKYLYLRFLRIRGNPHAIALGAAIGVFVGITPTIPFHTLIIFILTIATRSSFLAGLTVSWIVSNPLTYLPLYYIALVIGNLATPYHLDWEAVRSMVNLLLSDATLSVRIHAIGTLGYQAVAVLLVGGVLAGLPAGVLSYYLFRRMILRYRHRRRLKHILH